MAPSDSDPKEPKKSKFPTSARARASHLFSLATQIAKKEASYQFKNLWDKGERLQTQIEQARLLVASLKHLKGAAMKAGQLLSLELRDMLPPEIVSLLSELHNQGTSLPPEEALPLFARELSPELLSQLEISPTPFAAASIGQVHRATIKATGEILALKIQYPGIAESIDTDVSLLKKAAQGLVAITLKKVDIDDTFAEIGEMLKQETDYRKEAEFYSTYRKLLSESSLASYFEIPEVKKEYSTSRLLALTFAEGMHLNQWLAETPSEATRKETAHRLLSLYNEEFFTWGVVQTDPNPGNFLFRSGNAPIVLLDFGATKTYPAPFRKTYARFLRAVIQRDRPRAMALALDLELLDPRETPETQEIFFALVESILEAFSPEAQPFDFSAKTYREKTRTQLHALVQAIKFSPPPRPLLFLHRKLGGIFALIQTLDVKLDLSPYWPKE